RVESSCVGLSGHPCASSGELPHGPHDGRFLTAAGENVGGAIAHDHRVLEAHVTAAHGIPPGSTVAAIPTTSVPVAMCARRAASPRPARRTRGTRSTRGTRGERRTLHDQ